ncbi:LysR family transcriptional regulator [Ketogulonicigenium vulgare]|uniref:LysR family transcriptional regulator n=1 Tax=Ketogulonicigenium vulgare TaxID=92945 RepID=UPI002358A779|nr:LysR family transcriptional regulator [Ketogulonicigenium vulgare]
MIHAFRVSMDSRHLHYFIALAETLHFGHAAARMNMTQPPFSRQIAQLEASLGAQLVARNSRHVRLTAAGVHFLQDARRILADLDKAGRDARLIAAGQKGELRLGFMMHAADSILPDLVRRYRAAHPDVRITLREIIPADIASHVLQGEIDAGLTFASPNVTGLTRLPLLSDVLQLIMPKDHPLADRADACAHDLQDQDIILAPAHIAGALRDAVMAYFLQAGLVPRIGLEPGLQHSIVQLVAAGLGVALVPASVSRTARPDIATIPLIAPPRLDIVLLTALRNTNPAVAGLESIAVTMR